MKVDKTFNTYEEAKSSLRKLSKLAKINGAHVSGRTDSIPAMRSIWWVISLHHEGCRCGLCPVESITI